MNVKLVMALVYKYGTVVYLHERRICASYLMDQGCPFPKRQTKSIKQAIISFNELFDTVSIVLNSRDRALTFPFESDLEEECRMLKEDQKRCRSRAQKYLIETNRRRR